MDHRASVTAGVALVVGLLPARVARAAEPAAARPAETPADDPVAQDEGQDRV